MRLKNYLAASMTEAMNQVKEELGPDAIIISAETVDGQFKVVAALEEREDIDFNAADELKITFRIWSPPALMTAICAIALTITE